jgi:hypothetical protein
VYELINLDDLRKVGTKQAGSAAVFILIFGCLFTAAVFFFGFVGAFNPVWIAALVFGAFGLLAFAVGLYIFLSNFGQMRGVVTRALTLLDRETAHRFPSAPSTPALPEGTESVKSETADSRGGYADRKLFGIPSITLEWVCNYLGNKNSWAEARMETMPVPYVYPPTRFGKAEGNTLYNQLFHPERGVVCRAGIIGDRGGDGNSKGKLLIDNPVEMMERLKKLEQEDANG